MNKILRYFCLVQESSTSTEEAIADAINKAGKEIDKAISQNKHETTYFYSYPFFIEYFNRIFVKTPSISPKIGYLIQGMFMIYGWMPTILQLKCEYKKIDNYISEIFEILQHLKFCKYETIDEFLFSDLCNESSLIPKKFRNRFSFLQSFINNSIPGTSKLLHFLRPEDFPILDSNIYNSLYEKNGTTAGTQYTYREYIKDMHDMRLKFEHTDKIQSSINDMKSALGYENLTFTRAIELSIFMNKPDTKSNTSS